MDEIGEIYSEKSTGLSTDSWGISVWQIDAVEQDLPILTNCLRFDRYDLIQSWAWPVMPKLIWSLLRSVP